MSFSPALLSSSMIALAVAALVTFSPARPWIPALDMEAFRKLIRPWQQPALGIIGLLFLLVFFSGLQGGDLHYWLGRLRIKLPLLVIPLMFIMFPRFRERQLFGLYYLLIGWMSLMCIGIGINYLFHADRIHLLIQQGQPIPTPGNHIRFSVLMAYAVVCGVYLYWKKYYWKYLWERKIILGLSIFLFLFMHLLSVRSGLVVLYSTILVMGLYYTFSTKKYVIGMVVITALISIPVLAYQLVPSFRAKIEYMKYDRWMHRHEMGALYADSGRIISLEVGYEIFKTHPWLGIGVGHIQKEVNRIFQKEHPNLPNPLMPHNQFLYVLATTGILGLMVFLTAFFFPLFYQRNYRHPMLLASYTVFVSINMLEHNLENSGGIAFYAIFLSLLLNHFHQTP